MRIPKWKYTGMIKFLQGNMHRCTTADLLLPQIMREQEVDIAVLSEQHASPSTGWFIEDFSSTAAIWRADNTNFHVINSGAGNGYVWITSHCLTIISCYLTPSDTIGEFQAKLENIEDTARQISGHIIIAGDFNSKAMEWGSRTTNSRGQRILDMAARLGLVVANVGNKATFRRPGCEGTIPDITLVSESYANQIHEWTVLEDYNGSDHQYITYCAGETNTNVRKRNKSTRKWNVSKLDREKLIEKIRENKLSQEEPNCARLKVEVTLRRIAQACSTAMPRTKAAHQKKSVYWWTDEIRGLRQICISKRRRYTRARRIGLAAAENAEYKAAKSALKLAIKSSKKEKWEELRRDINQNPWGLGYKIVLKKLGMRQPSPELDEDTMENIVNTLFPTHDSRIDSVEEEENDPPPLFTTEELRAAATTLKNNKAPGIDGIPSEVLKVIADKYPQMLLSMYNACLSEGIFPKIWKRQKLVLISKGKGDPETPSAYRPLCMLDTAGKLLEKMLKPRIAAAINKSGGLSDRQHGFRPRRSTIGAIEDVVKSVENARSVNHFSRPIVLLVTIDVRNAFNSAKWGNMIDAMEKRFKIPQYLMKMIRNYLKDRVLIYDTNRGQRTKAITSGAAQGSILGPDLWNVSYDGILNMDMPDDCYLVGYADDIAAVIAARDVDTVRRKLTQTLIRIKTWLDSHDLSLAPEKTELILLTRARIPLEIAMPVYTEEITTSKVVKYLGIRLDNKLSYWAQIQYATEKAAKTISALSRLMANIGGPIASRRKLLMDTTASILLYGCEIWADALRAECRRKALAKVQRTAALRVASAYRTVSEAAVLIISGTIPIDLLARERKELWILKKSTTNAIGDHTRARNNRGKKQVRAHTLQTWQERWESATKGRWTARLIPNVEKWYDRQFGEINFYITQMLSGHGYFRKYLQKIGKAETTACIYGDAPIDDADHTFFKCERWKSEREIVEGRLGPLEADNIIGKMIENAENWQLIGTYIERVLRAKKLDMDRDV